MLTTFDNDNVFPNVSEVTRQERYNTPPNCLMMNIRRHVQHVNNGNVFRNVSEILVRNVNPPTAHPLMNIRQHVQHVNKCENQILYPHFGSLHFSNLRPFQGIVNDTSQN